METALQHAGNVCQWAPLFSAIIAMFRAAIGRVEGFHLFQNFEIQGLFMDLSRTFSWLFNYLSTTNIYIFKDIPVYCYC